MRGRSCCRLSGAGIDISLPPGLLGSVLGLGLLLGFLAALIPAPRSTRLDVLEVIQSTSRPPYHPGASS